MRPMMGCALLVVALSGTGCHTMKPVTLDQVNILKPDRAWVTDADQSVILVSGPQVVGDTLVGYVNGKYEEMPSAGFKQVIIQRSAPTRTALLAVGITVGLSGFFIAVAGNGGTGGKTQSDFCDKHPEDPSCS